MERIKRIKTLVVVFALLFCIGVAEVLTFPQEAVAATKENPKLVKKATICVGRRVQLKVTGTTQRVTWSSSNKKVVKISRKGSMIGIKKGTATVTAKIGKKKLTCKVKVVPAIPKIDSTLTIGNVGWKSISHYANEIYCKSSNKEIATVAVIPSDDGTETLYGKGVDIVVYGHKSGKATITITSDCNKEKVKFKVTVKKQETETAHQRIVDYVLLNGMIEEGTGDKVLARRCSKNNAKASIWYNSMSEAIQYEYEEENAFGKIKWLMMETEKDNTEVYMVMWLYPSDSKESYYVTAKIDTTSYAGETILFEDGWYGIPALEHFQGIANEVSKRAIACIDEMLKKEAEAAWRNIRK